MSVKIFCCYARKDQSLLNELMAHLMPLQRAEYITIWADSNINAGAEWEREIDNHLEAADIILLLVSSDFMASDYCYSKEMKRAMERHECGEAKVIPVILRPTLWDRAPFGKLQALPKDAIPVTDPKWHNLDIAFHNVAEGISKVVKSLLRTEEEPASDITNNTSNSTQDKNWKDRENRDANNINTKNFEIFESIYSDSPLPKMQKRSVEDEHLPPIYNNQRVRPYTYSTTASLRHASLYGQPIDTESTRSKAKNSNKREAGKTKLVVIHLLQVIQILSNIIFILTLLINPITSYWWIALLLFSSSTVLWIIILQQSKIPNMYMDLGLLALFLSIGLFILTLFGVITVYWWVNLLIFIFSIPNLLLTVIERLILMIIDGSNRSCYSHAELRQC